MKRSLWLKRLPDGGAVIKYNCADTDETFVDYTGDDDYALLWAAGISVVSIVRARPRPFGWVRIVYIEEAS